MRQLTFSFQYLWRLASPLKNNVHNFNYLHFQTTLPPMPDDVTLRDDGIYCRRTELCAIQSTWLALRNYLTQSNSVIDNPRPATRLNLSPPPPKGKEGNFGGIWRTSPALLKLRKKNHIWTVCENKLMFEMFQNLAVVEVRKIRSSVTVFY